MKTPKVSGPIYRKSISPESFTTERPIRGTLREIVPKMITYTPYTAPWLKENREGVFLVIEDRSGRQVCAEYPGQLPREFIGRDLTYMCASSKYASLDEGEIGDQWKYRIVILPREPGTVFKQTIKFVLPKKPGAQFEASVKQKKPKRPFFSNIGNKRCSA